MQYSEKDAFSIDPIFGKSVKEKIQEAKSTATIHLMTTEGVSVLANTPAASYDKGECGEPGWLAV